MNESTLDEVSLIFKGGIFDLAPLNIPLSIMVLIQNVVILMNYYHDRAKFVPCMYMGIALADILTALGQMVVSVVSVYVFRVYHDSDMSDSEGRLEVLFKSLYYYMVTALPGISCSKLLNIMLTLTLTVKIVNPFRIICTDRLKKAALIISLVIVCLHVSDTVCIAAYFSKWSTFYHVRKYEDMVFVYELPGVLTVSTLSCFSRDCFPISKHVKNFLLYEVGAVLNMAIAPILVLICMVIQVKYLKKNLPEDEPGFQGPPNTSRHVSITLFLISTLYFVCNSSFCIGWGIYSAVIGDWDTPSKHYYHEMQGIFAGLGMSTMPLIYAVLFPVILICRKPDLRARYVGYYQSLVPPCCISSYRSLPTQG